MTGPLAGRTAVVTGASRGIGRAIALRLAEAGAEVALWSRSAETLQGVADEVAALGGRAQPFACDVTDAELVICTVDQV